MRTEAEVRARLASMKRELVETEHAWKDAIRGHVPLEDRYPSLLAAIINDRTSRIMELTGMLTPTQK